MSIYDEITHLQITDPDLSAGYLYDGVIVTGRVEEHIQVIEGTVTADRPNGLRQRIPAQDITEPCQWYHTYTEEEKKNLNMPTIEQRLEAAEAAILELAYIQGGEK